MPNFSEHSEQGKIVSRTPEEDELEWGDAQHLLDVRCGSAVFWDKLAEAVEWAERSSLEYLEAKIREVKTRLATQGRVTRGLTPKTEMYFEPWEDGLEEWDRRQDDLRGILRKVLGGKSDVGDESHEARSWEEVAREFEISSPMQPWEVLNEAVNIRKQLKARGYESLRVVMSRLRNFEEVERELRAQKAKLRKEKEALKAQKSENVRAIATNESRITACRSVCDRTNMTSNEIKKNAKKDRVDRATSTQRIGMSGESGIESNRSEWYVTRKVINADGFETDCSVCNEYAGIKGANSCQESSGTCKRYSSADDLLLGASAGDESRRSSWMQAMLQIAERMRTQLLPLEKYSGKGERSEVKFNDFIEEFEARYGYETDSTKIRYLRSYLTGLALDSFLGISTQVREKGTFEEVMHSLRKSIVDSSKITSIGLQNNLSKVEWRREGPLIELFAYIDRKVAAAYPGMIHSDPYFADEKCEVAIQALRVDEELATRVITAVSQAKNGELYKALKEVALEYERVRKGVKKASPHRGYSRNSAGSGQSSPKKDTRPLETSSEKAVKGEGHNRKDRKSGGSNAVRTKGGSS